MNIIDIIEKKRDGGVLNKEEIAYFIQGYTRGEIPDYQISALLMAIYFNGMNSEETVTLTEEIIKSGDTLDLEGIEGIIVDKHSSGGVGDKITIILGPIIAALGLKFGKMSGRSLGFTGGTIDKLESIDGFKTDLDYEDFLKLVDGIGISITGQTGHLTPADKKLYALRDVTATVDIIPLIASSIMSKKLAVRSDALVLDVKVGEGAFMQNLEEAEKLAEEMLKIAKSFNRNTRVVISNMDQPLGKAVGNSVEIEESLEALKGNWTSDIKEVVYTLATELLLMAGKAKDEEDGRKQIDQVIRSGKALSKFKEMVERQGGGSSFIGDGKLSQAKFNMEVLSNEEGYVTSLNARAIGKASVSLGAGREALDAKISHSAGIILHKKIGDFVEKGEVLAELRTDKEETLLEGERNVREAYSYDKEEPKKNKMILKVIR